jgi:hypothetical protein
MSCFPDDHPVLAGHHKLSRKRVRERLLDRSLWLQEKIRERQREGRKFDLYVDELKAVEQAAEEFA